MDIAFWLSLAVFLMSILTFTEIAIGMRKVGLLRNVAPSIAGPTPWSRWCLAYWPVSGFVSLFIIWRGVILTLMRGGIEWRGTHYGLDELKRAHRQHVRDKVTQPKP